MKKILVVALSVALLLSTTACGTNSELEALKQENEQLKSQLTDTEEKATEKPTEKPTEAPTEKPAEKSEEQKTSDTQPNSDSTYELTAGDYEVPGDIPAGKYDVVALSGHGSFRLDGNDQYIGETMDENPEGNSYAIKERKNTSLKSGDKVTISSSLKVQLIPKN